MDSPGALIQFHRSPSLLDLLAKLHRVAVEGFKCAVLREPGGTSVSNESEPKGGNKNFGYNLNEGGEEPTAHGQTLGTALPGHGETNNQLMEGRGMAPYLNEHWGQPGQIPVQGGKRGRVQGNVPGVLLGRFLKAQRCKQGVLALLGSVNL